MTVTPSARGGPILWPLRSVSGNQLQALQSSAPLQQMSGMLQPILMRQRPRRVGGLLAPDAPVNLPWNAIGSPGLTDVPSKFPRVVHELLPLPARIAMITGVTRDNTGAVLGSCVVDLFETATDIALFRTTSDATTGEFTFTCARYAPATHYLVAYLPGSPDKAGTSVNTIVGS